MTIYLCRHGQTTGDVEDRYGGDYDDHLTDEGKNQASNLAVELLNKNIEILFSSPRIRAQETAKIISNKLNTEIITVEDFRERNQYGILTGMVKAEAKEKYPDLVLALKDYKNQIDGAEGYENFSERVNKALLEVAKKNFGTVAIVIHGGPIKAILRKIKYSPDYKIKDCAWLKLTIEDKNILIEELNGVEATV